LGVAGEAIGGNRLAYLDSSGLARYASANNILHANKVWAMSTQAASAGNSFNAVRTGEVEEGSWNWTLNMPVFLGNNGVPTQTLPGDAMFSLVIGFPVSSTKLFVNIREPIILN
jgi:hypothetical protein